MDSWRRQKGEVYHQETQRTRSNNRKPPLGNWQPTVPSWEKKFCTSVGSVPWRKLMETKKCMYLYDNVVQWNDSAGEEAFHNAKNRFWAEMNGLPCDISLPDPDIYIDEIDWNSNIDPELLLDLEREPVAPDEGEQDEKVVILGNALVLNQSFSCTGWGEAEEDLRKASNSSSGPGFVDCDRNVGNNENPWERNCAQGNGAVKENGSGNCWNSSQGWNQCENNNNEPVNSWGWNQWENNNWNQWENNNYASENFEDGRTDGAWGTWNGNNRKREGASWNVSRYKTSRFHGDDYQTDRGWRNGRGRKRVNFVYERPFMDKKPASRQWNTTNSCGPVSHPGSGKAGNPWSWEKPVS